MKGSLARFYLAAALLPGGLFAQNQFFDGEALDTAWSSAANWSQDTLPVARAVIAGDLTATTTSGDAFTVTDLQVGSGVECPAGNGALTMNGGTINASELTVGRNGHEGTVTLSNGAILNLSGHLRIARHDGSVGTVEIGGAASEVNVAGQIIVGNNESGSGRVHAFLNQNGGTINMAVNQDFQVANNQFSDGTFNQTGGTLNTLRWMNLGRADGTSTAVLNTAGNVHAGNTIQLRHGTWNQSGGLVSNGVTAVSTDINLGVDPGGDGTFIQSAGTLYASRHLQLGRAHAQGTGNMDVSGTVDAGENITVNNGTFHHRAGAHVRTGVRVTGGDLNVGTAAGSSGTYLYEGGSLAVGDILGIGRDQGDGTGHMSINGNIDIDSHYLLRNGTIQHNSGDIVAGLQNNNADFNMGSAGSGSGNYNLVSGSITIDRNMNLQNGTFTQQAGAVVLGADHGGDLSIGTANGVEGTYDQQGGTLTIGNNLNIGGWSLNTGVGHFASGSAQSVGRTFNLNKGSYRQTNGDLIVGSVLSDGDLTIADGTSEDGTLEVLNGNLVVADQVIIGQNEAGGFGRATVNGNVTTESHLSVRNGFLDVSNGALDIGTALNTASVNIGNASGGVGTMNLDSTGFQVSQHLNINKGSFIQSNGSTVVGARHTDGDLTIADWLNEDASLEIQGGNLTVADEVSIGRSIGDAAGHGVVDGNVSTESNFWLRHGTFTANTGTVDIGTDNVNADLQIGYQTGGVGTFTFNGTSFVLSRTLHINKGAFVQQSGTVSIGSRSATPGSLNIGTGSAEDGSYTLNGGSLTVAGELLLGQTGFGTDGVGTMESHGDVSLGKSAQVNRGTWNHDTGNLVIGADDVTPVSDLFVGSDPGEDALFTFTGGTLTVPHEFNVGRNENDGIGHIVLNGNVSSGTSLSLRNGTGIFGGGTLDVGVNNTGADFNVGSSSGGSGVFTLTDGTINVPEHMSINRGSFTQEAGLVALGVDRPDGDLYIATDPNEEGSYIQHGGTLTVPDRIYIGRADSTGTGYMTINATVEAGDDVEIRRGTLTQTGGDFTVGTPSIAQNSSFLIGTYSGWAGRYDQLAGNLTVERNLYVGQYNGPGNGAATLDGHTDIGTSFLFRRGTVEQAGTVLVGTSNVLGDFNLGTDPQGDANYTLRAGGTIDVVDRMHIGRSDGQGTGTVESSGALSTGDVLDFRSGSFTQTGGSIAVGQVGANAGNPNARTDADFNIGTGTGANAVYYQHGGTLNVARNINVGNSTGNSDAVFAYQGAFTQIEPSRDLNIRPNATLRTVFDNTGITVIETQGTGNINLNGSSTWDVDLAGGVFLSGIDNFTALEAAGSVNDSSNFSEAIWNRIQLGVEVVVLELAGGGLGFLDQAVTDLAVPSAEVGFIQIDEYAGSRIALLMDLGALNTTSDLLADYMRAGGQSVAAVDADTLRLHLDVPDDDSFFAWDFDDYNVEQGEVVNVMHLSLQVIPEPSSLALLLLGMLALHRLRRRP